MSLEDLHRQTLDGLRQSSLHKKGHSWIFTGTVFSHVEHIARVWLKQLICEAPTPDTAEQTGGNACGTCRNCQLFEHHRYPYLSVIQPTSRSRHILVNEIRELEHFLFLKTAKEKKIALILEADRMVDQAQNAFLKTLEEPPNNTFLVLVTANIQGLLPTIRSRCYTASLFGQRYEYTFSGVRKLFPLLAEMRRGKGAIIATKVAYHILESLEKLYQEAKHIAKEEPDEQIKPSKKKRSSEDSDQETARYLFQRDQVISATYTWYAQEFIRSYGVPLDKLPYPEFYADIPSSIITDIPDEKEAIYNLRYSEQLIHDLTLNVDEELVLKNYCLSICEK